MPRLEHFDHDGRARFVTFSTYRRLPILTNAKFRDRVVEAIASARAKYGFRLLAYVIMPEHVHIVLWPPENLKVGPMIGEIKRDSSESIHTQLGQASTLRSKLVYVQNGMPLFRLWQYRCYDHNCRTEQSVCEKVNYCHWNPVKRGLVKNPAEWAWSSFRSYENLPGSLLDVDAIAALREEPIAVRGLGAQ